MAARLSLSGFLADEGGATAVEYGMIVALVFLVIVTSLSMFGSKTSNMMNMISSTIGAAIGP